MENKNQLGQSTVEFILSFAFGVSIVLFIFNASLKYATGYLVHYATFMASRVYLTADKHVGQVGDPDQAHTGSEARAKDAFMMYNLSVIRIPNENFKINTVLNARANFSSQTLTVGAYTTFDVPIDILGQVAGQKKLELVSESFLGKEPTRAECATRVCKALTDQDVCSSDMDITLFDDGC
jgi:hypothetical protein